MKKISKKTLSFLFALILIMQLALPVANATSDTSVPEPVQPLPRLSYALSVELTPEQYNASFKAEGEEDITVSKIVNVPAEKESLVFPEAGKCAVSYSATADKEAQALTRADVDNVQPILDGRSIDIFVPAGYYVTQLYLRADHYPGEAPISLLPLSTAALNSGNISIPSDTLTVKENDAKTGAGTVKLNPELINATADYDSLVLEIELSILPEEKTVTFDRAAETPDENGDYALTVPAIPEHKTFDGWKVVFSNRSSLMLSADTVSVAPYTSCDIVPFFTDIKYDVTLSVNPDLTMAADASIPENYFSVEAPEGFTVEGVDKYLSPVSDGGSLAAPANEAPLTEGDYNVVLLTDKMVVKNGDTVIPTASINLTVNNGTIKVTAATPAPAPETPPVNPDGSADNQGNTDNQGTTDNQEKPENQNGSDNQTTPVEPVEPAKPIEITVKANAPKANADKTAVEADGFVTIGEFKDGDKIKDGSIALTAKQSADNSQAWYIEITGGEIVKEDGSAVDSGKYTLKRQNSDPVTLPIAITIEANAPKLGADSKYVANGFTVVGLVDNDGVRSDSVVIELVTEADGKLYAQAKPAEGGIIIENNGTAVAEGKYAAPKFTPSESITPEVPAETVRGELELKPADIKAVYDGKEHAADKAEIVSGALAEGDTLEAKFSGSAEDYTSTPVESTISKVVIKDKDGKDVTDKYTIKLVAGSISISKRPITFTAATLNVGVDKEDTLVKASKLPDAQGFSKGFKIEDGTADEGLAKDHKVKSITVNGEGRYKDLKGGDRSFETSIDKSSIKISSGLKDVTDNYDIKTNTGKIKLTFTGKDAPKNIALSVTAKSAKWTYDGKAHELKEIDKAGGLIDGDQIKSVSFKNTSTITNAGSVKNEISSVVIVDKSGNPVPVGKYKISYTDGTLTVDKFNLTVTAESASKVYDGKALENKNVSVGKLANSGHTIQIEYTIFSSKGKALQNPPIDPGTYTKKITKVNILDAAKNNLNDNYKINTVDGTLTIKSGDKNNSTGPKTGDEANIGLWIGILAVSAVVIIAVVVVIVIKNKKKSEEDVSENDSEIISSDNESSDSDHSNKEE